MCWLLGKTLKQQQQAVAAPVSSELEKHVKTLRDVVELELGELGNGKIKEIEFEFKNQIEATFHFVSDEVKNEVFCLSKK